MGRGWRLTAGWYRKEDKPSNGLLIKALIHGWKELPEAQTGKRIVSPLTAKQALAEKTAEGIEHPEADTTE